MKYLVTFAIFIFVALLLHCKVMMTKNISDLPCHIVNISENGMVTVSCVNRDIKGELGPRTGFLHGVGELDEANCALLKEFIAKNVIGSQITGERKGDASLVVKYYKEDSNGDIAIRSLNEDFAQYKENGAVLIADKN
ncbi:hypothetical protein AAEX28_11605 [Lentisphaerota bacterium WC36G]|nr:hypothetical protein LJT99_14440 [Lentisphaerae bacterium WC36]